MTLHATQLAWHSHGAGDKTAALMCQSEPIANALIDDPPQVPGQRNPGVV